MPDNERAEKGREILKSRAAQGEPGSKQPAHKNPSEDAEGVLDELKGLQEKHGAETRGPSAGPTTNNPVPAHERTTAPVTGGGIAAAAAAIGAARSQIENELIADARLASDPRRERDQKIFEMGQRGELGFVPPSEAELAAAGAKLGTKGEEVIAATPKTGAEQVDQDMPRLKEGERLAAQAKGAQATGEHTTKDSETRTGMGKPGGGIK